MIYLDHNASTPADPRVIKVMLPYFGALHANASSSDHAAGALASRAVEAARAEVARLIRAEPEEIVFTAGATEANNIAILGTLARSGASGEILVGATEHPAVLEPARSAGDRMRSIPVDSDGVIDLSALRELITEDTALVAVMAANNETGVIQPIEDVAAVCASAAVPLHVDAAQAAGRIPLDVAQSPFATLAISGHKMYGPQGVGALYVRRRRPRPRIAPVLFGGGHERNLRPGSLNVPGIVGLGEAARLVRVERADDETAARKLRASFLQTVKSGPADVIENVANAPRLAQTVSMRFVGVRAAAVVRQVANEIAISTGSACSTTSVQPSHVLLAQGLSREAIAETLRISFGRSTTLGDVERAAESLVAAVERVASISRAAQPA